MGGGRGRNRVRARALLGEGAHGGVEARHDGVDVQRRGGLLRGPGRRAVVRAVTKRASRVVLRRSDAPGTRPSPGRNPNWGKKGNTCLFRTSMHSAGGSLDDVQHGRGVTGGALKIFVFFAHAHFLHLLHRAQGALRDVAVVALGAEEMAKGPNIIVFLCSQVILHL